MQLKIYTVYDSKVEAYLQPFFLRTKGEALRSFSEAVNDQKTQFNKYPSDYTLFEIGSYEESSGKIDPHKALISLGTAIEFLKSPDQTNFSQSTAL